MPPSEPPSPALMHLPRNINCHEPFPSCDARWVLGARRGHLSGDGKIRVHNGDEATRYRDLR